MTLHDFADTGGSIRTLGSRRGHRFQRMIEALYAGAVSRDVYMREIEDEMARVTGAKADAVIRCGVEPGEFDYIRTKTFLAPQNKIRIGYPGTIVTEEAFALFVEAIRLLQPRLPLPVEINLFGVHSYKNRPWFDPSLIIEHGYLPEEELTRRFRACNWGLALMEMDDSNPRYSRFTFPCKFSGALAAALPLICLGHPECTLTHMARKYQLGPVITSSSTTEIADQLLPALSKLDEPDRFRDEILRCADTEFNAERNRQTLRSILLRAGTSQASRS
jgi:glycosyltransferase involved in cell wall biosynthesis